MLALIVMYYQVGLCDLFIVYSFCFFITLLFAFAVNNVECQQIGQTIRMCLCLRSFTEFLGWHKMYPLTKVDIS